MGPMVQHTMPKGCTRRREYGVQAPKTLAKVQGALQVALAQGEGVGKGAVQRSARLTDRQRYEQSTGQEPLLGPHCRCEMGGGRLGPPTYGVIYDAVQGITRGLYASTPQRAGPCYQG